MSDVETRVCLAFRHHLDQVGAPALDLQRLGRARRTRAFILAGVFVGAMTLLLGAVAMSSRFLGNEEIRRTPVGENTTSSEVSIVCTDDGTTVLTPTVHPSNEGIRIRIDNRTTKREFFMIALDGSGNEGGTIKPNGITELSSYAPPGTWAIACFEDEASIRYYDSSDPAYEPFTIKDDQGIWTPKDLACDDPARSEIDTDAPTDRKLNIDRAVRRYVAGLQDGDLLERPGYPDQQLMWETRIVVRNGERIASVHILPSDTWRIWLDSCPDNDLRLSGRNN